MAKSNLVQTICSKEMDRREFLKYSGIALLGVIGLKGLAALLMAPENQVVATTSQKSEKSGFGSGKYGV